MRCVASRYPPPRPGGKLGEASGPTGGEGRWQFRGHAKHRAEHANPASRLLVCSSLTLAGTTSYRMQQNATTNATDTLHECYSTLACNRGHDVGVQDVTGRDSDRECYQECYVNVTCINTVRLPAAAVRVRAQHQGRTGCLLRARGHTTRPGGAQGPSPRAGGSTRCPARERPGVRAGMCRGRKWGGAYVCARAASVWAKGEGPALQRARQGTGRVVNARCTAARVYGPRDRSEDYT